MAKLGELVTGIRSKNAGPYWITIDIFCGSANAFNKIRAEISTDRLAALFHQRASVIKRFDIATLNVVKFSLPRTVVQGSRTDRDMHGAQWAQLLAELEIN